MVRQNPEIPIRMLRKFSRRLRELAAGEICVDLGGRRIIKKAPPPPPAPAPAAEPAAVARIVHPATGTEFPLGAEDEIFIGRKADPATGFRPQIELAGVDTQRSTSRRHARLIRREGQMLLREEIGVANGTFVNNHRVATGVEVELHDGDEIRFGLVKTVLQLA
jgi:pSer/pThr/pTyr-binding forkhead associated (FHA) protein